MHTCADFGHHDLVMRRSISDGRDWEPLRTILDPETLPGCNQTEACLPYTSACQGPAGCNIHDGCNITTERVCGGGCAVWDPTPVVDKMTGEVHVFFGRSKTSCVVPGHTHGAGSGGWRDDLWVMTSSTFGATWSEPRNVTAECSTPYGGGVTGSEGHGIQLASGELIVPLCTHCTTLRLLESVSLAQSCLRKTALLPIDYSGGKRALGQGLCKSNDHGKTWVHGGAIYPDAPGLLPSSMGEGEIVELFTPTASGVPRLMYDMRIAPSPGSIFCASGAKAGTSCRATAISSDLGMTWGTITAHPEMP